MSHDCLQVEHLECDGTQHAPWPEWGWDPCDCFCHPAKDVTP